MTVLVEEAPSTLRPQPAPVRPHPLPAARGPLSQGVLDFSTGGRGDVVDASSGVAGQPDDEDFQLALWLCNVLQVATFEGVDPDRPASLRMRTMHWYLDRGFEAQLRRLVAEPPSGSLGDLLRSLGRRTGGGMEPAADVRRRLAAAAPHRGWSTEVQMLALARIEAPIQATVARLVLGDDERCSTLRSRAYREQLDELRIGLVDAVSAAPACSLALANAAWLFARERRLRGAAVGQLCLLHAGSAVVDEELVPQLERLTPGLVDDAAWGARVTAALQDRVAQACARRPSQPQPA